MTETAIKIRQLGPDDLSILCRGDGQVFDGPVRPDQAEVFLNDPMQDIVLAFDGEDIIGSATGLVVLQPDKVPAYFVNEVDVAEAYQRQGIATQLMQTLKHIAKERGCDVFWLATEHDNIAARALYRSLDMKETEGIVMYELDL